MKHPMLSEALRTLKQYATLNPAAASARGRRRESPARSSLRGGDSRKVARQTDSS